MNSCEEGVSELFREPMQVLYTLMAERYYNYKFVETELGAFTNMSSDATAKAFLNIKMDADGNEYKADDLGTVAFMPSAMSLSETIAKVHADYHSEIAYEFVLAPVSDEGGFAYMSPATGIAVNRNSAHQDWAVRFLNFLFEPDNNREYAKKAGIIPCTKDALTYITERFDVPDDRISQLGQVSFDYQFYNLMSASLVEISKGNNPKYMDTDEDGNPVLFDFEYYMSKLEERFADQRAEDEAVSG